MGHHYEPRTVGACSSDVSALTRTLGERAMGEWDERTAERARVIAEALIAGLLVLFGAYALLHVVGAV
jgi:hypothetical protein